MALTLVATAGAANANSYATVAEANSYHESHLYATTWNDAVNEPTKIQALVWATRMLDQHFEWSGSVSSLTQALRWPRVGAYDRDGRLITTTTIPDVLKNATAELARWLIDSDRTAETASASGEIQEIGVGPINIKYVAGSATDTAVVPDAVVAMLSHIGVYLSGQGGAIHMRRG